MRRLLQSFRRREADPSFSSSKHTHDADDHQQHHPPTKVRAHSFHAQSNTTTTSTGMNAIPTTGSNRPTPKTSTLPQKSAPLSSDIDSHSTNLLHPIITSQNTTKSSGKSGANTKSSLTIPSNPLQPPMDRASNELSQNHRLNKGSKKIGSSKSIKNSSRYKASQWTSGEKSVESDSSQELGREQDYAPNARPQPDFIDPDDADVGSDESQLGEGASFYEQREHNLCDFDNQDDYAAQNGDDRGKSMLYDYHADDEDCQLIQDYAPSSVLSFGNEEFWDADSTTNTQLLLDNVEDQLYHDLQSPQKQPLLHDCEIWKELFPHIRVVGRNIQESSKNSHIALIPAQQCPSRGKPLSNVTRVASDNSISQSMRQVNKELSAKTLLVQGVNMKSISRSYSKNEVISDEDHSGGVYALEEILLADGVFEEVFAIDSR
eukprot:TRINITY_DN8280_c0_g1_i3.p1 TRINITY_DN8280_c0_g1~~TRINITY_DN8280_c0_g1_i3.p1  ORF type:complete len:433 (+),score=103.76 TRINITY_DN8280_c0_g1_i3:39-1337(+)